MALNFPIPANQGDTYSFGGTTWIYDGNSWNAKTNIFSRSLLTILGTDWNNTTTVTKQINGMTDSKLIFISPGVNSYVDFATYQIRAVNQGLNTITFECTTIPPLSIEVNVAFLD
jgi:hypothetical protein